MLPFSSTCASSGGKFQYLIGMNLPLWPKCMSGWMDVGMVMVVITGSPNVTTVELDAFWNEEDAKIVLDAIEGKQLYNVTFGTGSRKWRKEEIENFVRRMGDRIRQLKVYVVEESPASASAGLHLSSRLKYLRLFEYPPLPSLSLPRTLKYLELTNICPLPSSISDYPLPPLLEHLMIVLAPFAADGKTSVLPSPFDLSHLIHLRRLILDGGEETSNLISPKLFSTLKNAQVIHSITLYYCVVDLFDFLDFIHWFLGNDSNGWHLEVHLFFGEWREEEIAIARSTMEKYTSKEGSGIWEPGQKEEVLFLGEWWERCKMSKYRSNREGRWELVD
ncbi:hypothetical protein BT69DRAFT_1318120 [Atractiella rhizophila]|nr:hypothetical protein BT69DRAFT_1318120 [Atractiella rhizophila]